MGLVWKLHTGVIDDSWIRILNRLWIGNLRLGATINGLVLTSVSLFPFYIVSGSFGLMGIFCRKRTFLTLVRCNTTNTTKIKVKPFFLSGDWLIGQCLTPQYFSHKTAISKIAIYRYIDILIDIYLQRFFSRTTDQFQQNLTQGIIGKRNSILIK